MPAPRAPRSSANIPGEVLAEFGFSEGEIAALIADGSPEGLRYICLQCALRSGP